MSPIRTARGLTALLLFLSLTLTACGNKGGGGRLTVLDARNREAASLPNLRPLSLPPRYNLDGGQTSLSQPSASLNKDGSLSIGTLSAGELDATDQLRQAAGGNASKDKAFLQKLLAQQKLDANIRREIAESNKQPVPISEPLLKAIRENIRDNIR